MAALGAGAATLAFAGTADAVSRPSLPMNGPDPEADLRMPTDPAKFHIGQSVEARFHGLWYDATVTTVGGQMTSDGKIWLHWHDGTCSLTKPCNIRLPAESDSVRREIRRIFSRMDTNADGRVDFTEFCKVFCEGVDEQYGETVLSKEQAEKLFGQWDTQNTGYIDIDELVIALRPAFEKLAIGVGTRVQIHQAFSEMNTETGNWFVGKGTMCSAKLIGEVGTVHTWLPKSHCWLVVLNDGFRVAVPTKQLKVVEEQDLVITQLRRLFTELDINATGYLDLKEFCRWMAVEHKMDNEFSARLFEERDTDSNGLIDFGEFVAAMRPVLEVAHKRLGLNQSTHAMNKTRNDVSGKEQYAFTRT